MSSSNQTDDTLADWLSQIFIETSPKDTVYIADWHLKQVVGRPPVVDYIKELWNRRHFIMADARAKAFSNSKNMLLGHLWLILQPAFDIALYGFIFGFLLKTSRGIDHFLGYLIIGITFFTLFTKSLSGGASLIQANRNMIRAFPFPRATLGISLHLRYFLDSLPTIGITLVALPITCGIGILSPTWLFAIPLIALLTVFCLGLLFITARICHAIPDLSQLIRVFSRFWFYGSGVFFSIDRFGEYPTVQTVMKLNPAYCFLNALRDSLLYRTVPTLDTWLYLAAWSIGLLILGFIIFWRKEIDYGKQER